MDRLARQYMSDTRVTVVASKTWHPEAAASQATSCACLELMQVFGARRSQNDESESSIIEPLSTSINAYCSGQARCCRYELN